MRIENSYLFDNVTVDDNCEVDTSLLCSGVHVLENVVIGKGCVLAWEVRELGLLKAQTLSILVFFHNLQTFLVLFCFCLFFLFVVFF